MTKDFTFDEAFSGYKAMQKRIAFETDVESTPLGKQSFELRQRAHKLREDGDIEGAIALYEKAAGLFATDDTSSAAAMAWFDLARSYEHKADGVRVANLRNAESLYRRVLRSPALPKDPHRMGMVRDALASCLRHLAYEADPATAEKLLTEAIELFQKAVKIALQTGVAGFEDVLSFSHNLANCHSQRGNHDAALFAMDRAEAFARRSGELLKPGAQAEYLSRILVHAAGHRVKRNRKGDLEQAKKQLGEAIHIAHPDWVDTAEMRLAWILLRETPPAREQAKAILRRLRVERIRDKLLPELAEYYVDAGMRKEALVLYHRILQTAMERRRAAMADHVADHYAADAQKAAHKAARLHLEEEDALEAFFTLEDVSGLRFVENVEAFTRIEQSPLLRAVAGHHHARSLLAVLLEDYASRFALGHADVDGLLQMAAQLKYKLEHSDEDDGGIQERLSRIFEEATKHPDPVGFLRGKAHEVGREAIRIEARLREMDPQYALRDNKPWKFRLTREVIRDLLREYPDHAFVRLSLAEDLLVIAVWLEGDDVVARHHRVDVPPALFKRIAQHRSDGKQAPVELLQKIATDLVALDLSPALPQRRLAHAVVLPSFVASFLPLCALGPRGLTLLDHFDALSWMPSLAPLFFRQAATSPRQGVVSIAPGGTHHHAFAFGVPLQDETRIEGPEATAERVLAAIRDADVVCLYTHGRHASPRGPNVDLHGSEYLNEDSLASGWAGMERVELWACQSGVNIPADPLVPDVDEAFGLDVAFVRHGVRSAIGTLWSVPDLVTACIVRKYRNGLRQGLPAPHALAEAQRFWRDEGARSLLDHLASASTMDAGLRAFKATLGDDCGEEAHDTDLVTFLGPSAAPGADQTRRLQEQVLRLAHPLAWAGFRFVGVHERRPTDVYNPEHFRPITAEEMAEGARIVAETLQASVTEPPGKPFDEWVEQWLAEAITLAPGTSPSPEQAIRVSRLYRDRLVSSLRHNLLAALAWVHEAIAAMTRTKHGVGYTEARQKLALEAAWLWLELARGDAMMLSDLVLPGANRVALARAERELLGLPEDDHVRMLRAWIDLLKIGERQETNVKDAIARAWSVAQAILSTMHPASYEAIRTLTWVWELPLFVPILRADAAELCSGKIDKVLDMHIAHPDIVGGHARLRSVMMLLVMDRKPSVLNHADGMGVLTARELARQSFWFGQAHNNALSFERPIQEKRYNHTWDAVEGALWGWPDDDRSPIWASTGTLGGTYRRLAASMFVGIASAPEGAKDAIQLLACMQPLCDLRLPLLRRWVHLMQPTWDEIGQAFWVMARERDIVLESLEDAALAFNPSVALEYPGRFEPHTVDPFLASAQEIEANCLSVGDLLPWQLAHACHWYPVKETQGARTAAFHAVRSIEARTQAIVALWNSFVNADKGIDRNREERRMPGLRDIFDPGIRLPERRDMLRSAPPGALILGLAVEASGHLVAASMWNSGKGIEERVVISEPTIGWQVQDLLANLHVGALPDETLNHASARKSADVWEELDALLAPVLERVLGAALEGGVKQFSVLAPGSLRTLPLLGLRVGGVPLFMRVQALHHLPTLNIEMRPPPDAARIEACWLPVERERGDTSCGEAAVETLRRWFEPAVIQPPTRPTRDIDEVYQLDPLGPGLRTLRIYAASHPVGMAPSMAAFCLEGHRSFNARNTRGLSLPNCQEVELWAATAGLGPMDSIRRNDRDRLPGLVGDFLASGAFSVLDLAWPIFDLVKALVCELFGILRHRTDLDGCTALLESIARTSNLLASFREAASSFEDTKAALAFLDEARRGIAREAGLDPRAVVPLADRIDAPSLHGLSVEALVEEACRPAHLAAFRYWRWL